MPSGASFRSALALVPTCGADYFLVYLHKNMVDEVNCLFTVVFRPCGLVDAYSDLFFESRMYPAQNSHAKNDLLFPVHAPSTKKKEY